MIILATTSDVLRVVTSAAAALDCHLSYITHSTSAYVPARQNAAIASATTTTVLSAPSAGAQSQVKKFTANARGGANTVTVQFFDGTTAFQAVSVALLSGETLEYEDAKGWRVLDASGNVKVTGAGALTSSAPVNVDKSAAAVGTATTAARSDHKHDANTATTAAGAVVAAGTAAEGTATTLARSDHLHAVSVAAPVDIGTANAAGSAATFVRSDHVHNLPFSAVASATPGAVRLKDPVKAVSTINRTLSGLATTVDGIALNTDGFRVLLTAQTTSTQNGIWAVHSGAWTRPTDFATGTDAAAAMVVVMQGSTFANTIWLCITASVATVDSTSTVWAQVPTAGAGFTFSGQTINVGANADGSIVVNANDIQVGVLATDAQHGVRGGGTLHAAVVAGSPGTPGFMIGVDKAKLDTWLDWLFPLKTNIAAPPAPVAGTLQLYGDPGASSSSLVVINPNGVKTWITPQGTSTAGQLRSSWERKWDIQVQTTTTTAVNVDIALDATDWLDGIYTFDWHIHVHNSANDGGFIRQRSYYGYSGGAGGAIFGINTETQIGSGAGLNGAVLQEAINSRNVRWTFKPTLSETHNIDWNARLVVSKSALT